jgi:uncharacterized membrane protein
MVTEPYPSTSVGNLELNTLGDGLFHALTYVFTAIGLFWLWRNVQRKRLRMPGRILGGWLLIRSQRQREA